MFAVAVAIVLAFIAWGVFGTASLSAVSKSMLGAIITGGGWAFVGFGSSSLIPVAVPGFSARSVTLVSFGGRPVMRWKRSCELSKAFFCTTGVPVPGSWVVTSRSKLAGIPTASSRMHAGFVSVTPRLMNEKCETVAT